MRWKRRGSAMRRRLPDLTALVLLTAAILWLYRALAVGRVLAAGDLQNYFFPYWAAATRIAHESAPWQHLFWNPWLFAGAPLAANSQAGSFYPLNWPFWLLGDGSLTAATRTLHLSLLLHLVLAGWTAYALARRRSLPPEAAFFAGLLYGGGGFLALHTEHLNQLQGLAWLPLLFLPGTGWPALGLGMILLAGHTQTAFIAAAGLALFRLGKAILAPPVPDDARSAPGSARPSLARELREGAAIAALAVVMAAPQLALTLQLSRYSTRAGGLPWREALSFSLPPWSLPRALLPPYLVPPLLPEGVAYLGLGGLALAGWGLWQGWRRREGRTLLWGGLALAGLILALGGYDPLYLLAARLRLPGVIQFRAPSRYLALYALAMAELAACGVAALRPSRGRAGLLAVVLLAELSLALGRMPVANATAPSAYTDLRPATARLMAEAQAAEDAGSPPPRFLSLSKVLFEPGDEAEIEAAYGEALSEGALWAWLVAAKEREVLSPNLPLAFRVPAADGYDGGLLPTLDYVRFSRLLLPQGTVDGRLRENLEQVPDQRWLDLLDVGYLITDKTGDRWVDGVFYDCQFRPQLAAGSVMTVAEVPPLEGTALALLYAGEGEARVRLADGRSLRFELPAQEAATEPRFLRWEGAATAVGVAFAGEGAGLALEGATLVDERTGDFQSLTLSPRFRLIHSGDVKIYADEPPPRASFIPQGCTVADAEEALAVMREPDFDPARQVVLYAGESSAPPCEGLPAPDAPPDATVQIVAYEAQRVVVRGRSERAGYLLLRDGWYPAWEANGGPVLHADILFRAVPVPAGRWEVIFRYRPWGW